MVVVAVFVVSVVIYQVFVESDFEVYYVGLWHLV
jgi:hypothetical protein